MNRFRLLLVGVLMTTTLGLFVFTSLASAAPARRCTAHWHVVSSAQFHRDDLGGAYLGTVSLLRDGCGNIRAKLHSVGTVSMLHLYLMDTHKNKIGVDINGDGTKDLKTATYHHYGGISVIAVGEIDYFFSAGEIFLGLTTPPNSEK